MNINDFQHQKQYKLFEAKINNIEIFIPESQMSDEILTFANKIMEAYPKKVVAIAEYLFSEAVITDEFKEELQELLCKPRIGIYENGGILSYSHQGLDSSYFNDAEDWPIDTDEYFLLSTLLNAQCSIKVNFEGILDNFNKLTSKDERCIVKYDTVNAIRSRPGMYIGSTSASGIYYLIFELVEWLICNHAQTEQPIKINLLENNIVALESDIVENPIELWGISTLEIIKAVSDLCEVSIQDEKSVYFKGKLLSRLQNTNADLRKIKLLFRPDQELLSYRTLDYLVLFNRIKELAQLNPHLTFHLKDGKNKNIIHFKEGLKAMLHTDFLLWDEIFNLQFLENGIEVKASISFGSENCTIAYKQRSYINNLRTYSHGTHVQGLYKGVFEIVKKYAHNNDDKELLITKNDITARLSFVIQVKLDQPQFAGAVKGELTNVEAKNAVEKGVIKSLSSMLDSDEGFKKEIMYFVNRIRYSKEIRKMT